MSALAKITLVISQLAEPHHEQLEEFQSPAKFNDRVLSLGCAPPTESELMTADFVHVVLAKESGRCKVRIYTDQIDRATSSTENRSTQTQVDLVFITEEQVHLPGVDLYFPLRGERLVSDSQGWVSVPSHWLDEVYKISHAQHSAVPFAYVQGQSRVEVQMRKTVPRVRDYVALTATAAGSLASLLSEVRGSSVVKDVFSSEDMLKSGSSSAASALERMPGITLEDGQYVIARGMGDRYHVVLLNGMRLPGLDPNRKNIPVDLFQSQALQGVSVDKSQSGQAFGDFAGAMVDLRTKRFPERTKLNLSFGTNATAEAGQLSLQGRRSAGDWSGRAGGQRQIPSSIPSSRLVRNDPPFVVDGMSPSALQSIGRDLSLQSDMSSGPLPVGSQMAASLEAPFQFRKWKLGLVGVASYRSSNEINDRDLKIFTVGSNGNLSEDARSSTVESVFGVDQTALGSVSLVSPSENHKVSLTSLFGLSTQGIASQSNVRVDSQSFFNTRDQWEERDTVLNHLSVENLFLNRSLKMKWDVATSSATRNLPDLLELSYINDQGDFLYHNRGSGNRRSFDVTRDESLEIAMSFNWALNPKAVNRWSVFGGVRALSLNKVTDVRRFSFRDQRVGVAAAEEREFLSLSPSQLFSPENIRPDLFELTETTVASDNFLASQQLQTLSMGMEWDRNQVWKFNSGVQLEVSSQLAEARDLFSAQVSSPESTGSQYQVPLPFLNAVYRPTQRWAFKSGLSQSLSRPLLREIAEVDFYDNQTGLVVTGNANLRQAQITNFDVRAEHSPSAEELLAVGFFAKQFDQPIEMVVVPSTESRVSFANIPGAALIGVETDFRRRLAYGFEVSGNASLMHSEVYGVPQETESRRPLQGMASSLLNMRISHQAPTSGRLLSLQYFWIGRRLAQVGALSVPSAYEEPLDNVSFLWSEPLWGGNMRVMLSQLLPRTRRFTQGGQTSFFEPLDQRLSVSYNLVF